MKNQKPRSRKRKILHYLLTILAGVLALLLVTAADAVARLYLVGGPPVPRVEEKFIVASPVNTSQIIGLSKFRSCQGHDNSGKGETGQIEGNRSMKHYVVPDESIREELGVIELFAPFDGHIAHRFPGKFGDDMIFASDDYKKWGFLFFHIDLLEGLGTGSKLKAGQLMGHANVASRANFDIGLTYTNGSLLVERISNLIKGNPHFALPKADYLVSPFDYMSENVLADFKSAGFNIGQLQYSKQFRDENPCDFTKEASYKEDWQYLPGKDPHEVSEAQQKAAPIPDGRPVQQAPAQLYP